MSEPLSVDDAREHFSELVESVTSKRERITVRTPGGGEVVLMNADDLESLEATLEILSDPEARESLERSRAEAAAGLAEPLENHHPRPS
jgi:prevent-host-death family protein